MTNMIPLFVKSKQTNKQKNNYTKEIIYKTEINSQHKFMIAKWERYIRSVGLTEYK